MISARACAALRELFHTWEDEKGEYDDDFDYFTMQHLVEVCRDCLWHMSRGTVDGLGPDYSTEPSTIMDDPWCGPTPPPDRTTFEGLRKQARSFVMRVLRPNLGPGEYIEEVIYRITTERAEELGIPLPPPSKMGSITEAEDRFRNKILQPIQHLMNKVTWKDVEDFGLREQEEDGE